LKRIVVDASVVLKWFLSDEQFGQAALFLLDKYVSFELGIIAPSLLAYEVLNGLFIAQQRGRIEPEKTIMAFEGFIELEIAKKNISSIYPKIIHFSESYNLSAYDASYLGIADEEGIDLVTADKNFFNKTKSSLKWIKWLGDFHC
jgi:predicted nucleic acid-binding protein